MKAFVKIVFVMALILIFTVFAYAQDSARECLQKGLSYEARGMLNEALSEYEKAVSLDSTYSDAFFNIGLVYYKRNQWTPAIDAFKRVIELNPLDGEAHWQLSLVYGLSEKYTEAIKHYDRSQELDYTGGDPKLGKLLEPHRIKEYNLEYKPLLDTKCEKAVIKIRGNPQGDKILIRDVIRKLEIFEHVSTKGIFEEIDIEFINWEGSKTWFERWRVKSKNTENDYQIKFILCPDGGTDIYINLQPREMKEGKELGEVKDVFDAYRNAVKNRQYSSLARYATTESVQKGYHVMKDFQRANFLKYFDNNPYYVRFRGKTEAIIYFKESRNGTASPYIFTKEAGRWEIDFVKISQRIIYGPGNKWRWR